MTVTYLRAVKSREFGADTNFLVERKISLTHLPTFVHSLYRMVSSGGSIPDSRIEAFHVQLPYTSSLVRGISWFYSVIPSAEIVPYIRPQSFLVTLYTVIPSAEIVPYIRPQSFLVTLCPTQCSLVPKSGAPGGPGE
jgi:hypothetical protein